MMKTVFSLIAKSIYKDAYVLVWSIVLPLGLFIGLSIYNDSQMFRENLMVGCILMSIIMGALNTAGFWIMTQRKRGVYKLLKLSSFSTSKFILCTMLARLLVFEAITLLLLFTGVVVFGLTVNVTGTLALLGVTMVGMVCFNAIGFIIASRVENESTMNMATNAISLPMIFASSAFYTLDGAPKWLQFISQLNPVEYASVIGRSVMSGEVAVQAFGVLTLVAIACSIAAVKTFRYE
jgi:ABC-2 type transport system permease protein